MSATAATEGTPASGHEPKDDLYRGLPIAVGYRADEPGAGGAPAQDVLEGHFAVFNTWTEIRSYWEGDFLERFDPRAFNKTFKDGRDRMRCLFQHGYDPTTGDKPLGPIDELEADEVGARYGVPLLDTFYVRELKPGLAAGLYGASFRFSVVRESWVRDPEPSDYNPNGLDERTILEAKVLEFGPVTFPAYPDATAGLRSLTDHFLILRSADNDARRLLLERMKTVPDLSTRAPARAAEAEHDRTTTDTETGVNGAAPSDADAAPKGTSDPERREVPRSKSGHLTPADFQLRGRRKQRNDPPWSRH